MTRMPYRIESQRLVLRCYEPTDGPALFEAIDASRAELHRWLPWRTNTLEEAEASVRRNRGKFDLGQDFTLGIFRKADGRFLGGTGLHRFDWELGRFEIGYWLRTDELGKGYVTEAAGRLTCLCFDTLAARRVEIRVDTEHRASRAIAERLGFPLEGVARHAMALDGEPRDAAIYAMTRPDFPASPAAAHRDPHT
ncbi:MAG: GCN5-related N-acetyltransferase [Cyanobacteria bacterium RYN_339]|nr:GCN5-related N-acetyltransferase [Cyanobacteria bacterium RYN_339]